MGELTGQSSLDQLKRWAEGRGLHIRTVEATQREPEHVVVVAADDRLMAPLLKRESRDSIETAAFYVVNTLSLLGVALDG